MNIVETLLVFVGVPLGLSLLLFVAVYGRTLVHQNRYRPGRPWTWDPVWYLPHYQGAAATTGSTTPAPGVVSFRAAGPTGAGDLAPRMGGASGEW